jgi:WhiB family transcriptional regulator, redox-sensing transcriptional regulator
MDVRVIAIDTAVPEGTDVDGKGFKWQAEAACKGHGSLFFAPKSERPQPRARREAKARRICLTCPVLIECRSWARDNCEYGFWGGESEEQRHLLGFRVSAPIGIRTRMKREAEREPISA